MGTAGRARPAVLDRSPAGWLRWLRVVVACIAAAPPAAHAKPWEPIATSDDGLVAFYVDAATLTVRGPLRRVRMLYDYRSDQVDPDTLVASRSMTAVTEVDCAGRTLAGIEAIGYAGRMAGGKVVSRLQAPPGTPPRAATGSLDGRIVDGVCALRRGGR